ncbi:uncharacterized protein PITG_20783 [Phytophthora infestans T30-4]|uniref:Uncharacterized protein n=1 Tax=Phytophthora infestans (strain T30-4) TaxID=403677 RepID=D0P2N5_PHYIT|nr:uncharacterized protein PITG_20783 [Phytophthora infestans T30-4]EEY56695.1 hypothetical protein PITG_20783 [Phytophthora infestans T30-4]|eukprot:XP_002895438.1 hypothetical protein PITG_20783 [Phytophthora infestans T30-4]
MCKSSMCHKPLKVKTRILSSSAATAAQDDTQKLSLPHKTTHRSYHCPAGRSEYKYSALINLVAIKKMLLTIH